MMYLEENAITPMASPFPSINRHTLTPSRCFLLYVGICILLAINLRAYYLCSCTSVEVSQTDLASATDRLYMERRPLVITDRVADHVDMIRRSALRLLHVRALAPIPLMGMRKIRVRVRGGKEVGKERREALLVASARFTLLYQSHSDSTLIHVHHPSNDAGVTIVLRRHQTLVLPPRWRFACPDGVLAHELHDCVSLTLRSLGLTQRLSTDG